MVGSYEYVEEEYRRSVYCTCIASRRSLLGNSAQHHIMNACENYVVE